MFDRPRCRDWSPLSTQQLRLRSLIQISGHNITVPEATPPTPSTTTTTAGRTKCTVYFTLHQSPDSAPFYTSERADLHRNVLWAEIDCPATIKSSLRGVCVRVWERQEVADPHHHHHHHHHAMKVPQESDAGESEAVDERRPSGGVDRLLFTWGVYLSGLVPLARRSEKRLRPNTLVFQLHGGYFTSAASILEPEERVPPATSAASVVVTVSHPEGTASSPASALFFPPSATIPIVHGSGGSTRGRWGGGRRGEHGAENAHCDTSNNSSPALTSTIASSTPHFHFSYQTPASSYTSPTASWHPLANGGSGLLEGRMDRLSVSPVVSGSSGIAQAHAAGSHRSISPSPSTPPVSWTEPPETNLKLRYLLMDFRPGEVRPSYDLTRLLAIQERQRRIRYEADSAKTLTERICMKSAYCLNLELFHSKHLVYRTSAVGHRAGGMGKQLSRLLYQDREPIDPAVVMRGQQLRRDIERARFRCRLLAQERDRMGAGLQQLRNRLNGACDGNIERESALMERCRTYGREKDQLYQQKMAYAHQKDSVRDVCARMLTVRHQLLRGLSEIYYIKTTSQGIYTINDVPLPNAESYSDSTPALALSVALGFVAHAVMMCSSFLNIPLRNPIKYDGSRSKIVDQIKVLPTMDRDFPLHCRSGPAPNALLYGVYLLNQNISQLKHQLSMSRGDPRATLVNLQDILTIPGIGGALLNRELEEPFQTLPASVFGSSSIDLKMSPVSGGGGGFTSIPTASSSGSSSSGSFFRESPASSRISRSVDNYTDRFLDRRQQILHHRQQQVHRYPLGHTKLSSSSGSTVEQDNHPQQQHQQQQQRRGCGSGSKFSSDPILAQGVPVQRPFDFDGGKKF